MSKDKYLSIFLKPNEGYCGYYPSNIFRNQLEYLNISFKNSLPSKTFRAYVLFLILLYRPAGLSLLLSQKQTVPPS